VIEDVAARRVRCLAACNQRGGRMLTLVDLIEAGTVSLDLAAYLAAALAQGASHLVGANPGGAGKTTVMAALLSFLPPSCVIETVASAAVLRGAADVDPGTVCYLAHEVGAGHYYAYIWGAAARAFFALAGAGHTVATNLHADTLDETRAQLCDENGVDPADLQAVTLKLYLRLHRGRGWQPERRVSLVYESDGTRDRLIWTHSPAEGFRRQASSAVVSAADEAGWRDLLSGLLAAGKRELAPVVAAVFAREGR
jgi:hypothetical protein